MQLYKNNDKHFFIQLDQDEFNHDDFTQVYVEKHEGAGEKHTPVITQEKN